MILLKLILYIYNKFYFVTVLNKDPNVDEMVAAVKIGKIWRGYYVRKIKESRTPGTTHKNITLAVREY